MAESKPCCSETITERTPLLTQTGSQLRRSKSNSVLLSSEEEVFFSRDGNRPSETHSAAGRLRGLTSPPDVNIQDPNFRSWTGDEPSRKQRMQRRSSETPVRRRSKDTESRRQRRAQRDSDEAIWINNFYSDLRVRRYSYRHEDLDVHDVQDMAASEVEDLLDTDVENICYDHFWSEWPRSMCEATVKMKQSLSLNEWLCPTATKRFAVCAVIAVLVPVVCLLLLTAIDLGSLHKHNFLVFLFETAGSRHDYMVLFFLLWVTINCFIAFILFCISFSLAPEMTGSGVPELRAFISGSCVTRILRWRTLVAKAVAVLAIGMSEMPLGVLEPMLHIGGLIGAGVSQGRASSFRLDLGIFGEFRIDAEKRLFATCGAASAFACAFGSPVSGVLFVMEYVSARWTQAQMVRTMWSCAISATVAYIWGASVPAVKASAANGHLVFGPLPEFSAPWFDVLASLLLGCLGCVPAAAFLALNRHFQRARSSFCRSRSFRLLEVLVVAAVASLLMVPLLLGAQPLRECRLSAAAAAPEQATSFACPAGLKNAIGGLVGQVPARALKLLIHEPDAAFGPALLTAFGASMFLLSAYCYGTVMPGGIFVPSLVIGACWGRLLSHGLRALLAAVAPSSAAYYGDFLSADKFAMLGASAQLSGVLQAPLTISVMFAEATGSMEATLFVAVAAMASKLCVQQLISGNFYDLWSHLLRLPQLDPEPRAETLTALKANGILARHIMSTPVTYVRCTDEVGRVLRILELSPHNGFPVISGEAGDVTFGQLRGLIDRKRLLALIEHKNLYSKELNVDLSITLNRRTFERPRPASLREVSVAVGEDDMMRQVVVAEYMNLAPFFVQENASYLRVYNLFFELGLRHLPVVNSDNELVGIITRKDLLRYRSHCGQLVECPFGAVVENED